MIPVRQSTAFETAIGPVLDADGVAVTDCVVGDFKIKKTTGNFAALNGSATLTHVSAGMYDLVLTTSDLDTVGLSCIAIDDGANGCAPLYLQVVEEAVYDAFYAASAPGYVSNAPVNVAQWSGSNVASPATAGYPVATLKVGTGTGEVNLSSGKAPATIAAGDLASSAITRSTLAADTGLQGYSATAQAGGTNTITLDAGASATNSIYRSRAIKIVSGTGTEQVRTITAYNGTTKVATVNRVWNVQPDNTSVFVVLNTGPSDMVASWGVGGDDGYGPAGFNALAAEYIDNGGISSVVIGTIGDVITAASLAADAIAEIQDGLATAAELAKVPKSDGTGTWNATALASINSQCDTALADYDGPTNAEMVARTLAAASYATSTAQTTAQNDLDILTGSDGVTLATSQPNYAPATSAQAVAIQGATFDTATDSLEALRNRGDAAWVTATGFSTHSAADVVTALGTGSGLTALATQASVTAIAADLPAKLTKNTAFANFMFKMLDEDGNAATGLTITSTRSLDGAAFGACVNSAVEVGTGWYKIDLAAVDTNGNMVVLKFTATGAETTEVAFITQST